MNEPKQAVPGAPQSASGVVQAAEAESPVPATCDGACAGSAETSMQYAVPMETGMGKTVDMTQAASAPASMQYAVPMTTGIGPVLDMTQPRILAPPPDGAVARMVAGAAFIDLTQPRVLHEAGAVAIHEAVAGLSGQMQTRVLIGEEDYEPVLDTTAYPQRTVVKIGGGTGIMIGRRTVLTCAHALLDAEAKLVPAIHVVPALADVEMPYGDAWVAVVRFDPELEQYFPAARRWRHRETIAAAVKGLPPSDVSGAMGYPQCVKYDFAIAILDRPLGIHTGRVDPSEAVWDAAQKQGECARPFAIESYGYPDTAKWCESWQCPNAGDLPSRQMYHVTGTTWPLAKPRPVALKAEPLGIGGIDAYPVYKPFVPAQRFGCEWLKDGGERIRFTLDVLGGQSGSALLLKAQGQGAVSTALCAGVVTHGQGAPDSDPPKYGNSGTLVNRRRSEFLEHEKWRDDLPSDFDTMDSAGWTLLYGGESLRPPALVAYGTDRLDVFFCTSSGLLLWRRLAGGVWGDLYNLQMNVSHAPSAAVCPGGRVHIAARRPNGRLVAGVLHEDSKMCDWENLSADTLTSPTIVAEDQSHVHLVYLTNNPAWNGSRTTPRRTVGWYAGEFDGTTGGWDSKGLIDANPAGDPVSIRSGLAATSIVGQIVLAGVDTWGRLVWRFIWLGRGLSKVQTPWIGSWEPPPNPERFLRPLGTPVLVRFGARVYAVVRSGELESGEAYRILLDPYAQSTTGEKFNLPEAVSGDVAACAYGADEVFVFGRVCKPRSALHGTVIGRSLSSSQPIRDFDEGGRMIDVRAAVLGSSVWLIARGYDLKLYYRRIALV